MLSESIRREELLEKKLQEFTSGPPAMQPLEELGLLHNRFDEFLRFCLKKAPIIVAHQVFFVFFFLFLSSACSCVTSDASVISIIEST
jgi:hypothetical protein